MCKYYEGLFAGEKKICKKNTRKLIDKNQKNQRGQCGSM